MSWWVRRQLLAKQPRKRQRAAYKLGQSRDKKAINTLLLLLRDENEEVQASAAEALGEIGDKIAVEPLIQIVEHGTFKTSPIAARALVKIGDSRAVNVLVRTMRSSEPSIREAAAEALETMGWQPPDSKHTAWYLMSRQHWYELFRIGDESVEALILAIKTLPEVPYGNIEIRSPRALEILLVALTDDDYVYGEHVRKKLEYVIRKTVPNWAKSEGSKDAVPKIVSALAKDDTNYEGKIMAAKLLGEIGDSSAIPSLVSVITSEKYKGYQNSIEVANAAAIALGKIGDPSSIAPLIGLALFDWCAWESVEALKAILIKSAPNVSLDDLRSIRDLTGITSTGLMEATDEISWPERVTDSLDVSMLTKLAEAEIARRGKAR